MVEIHFAPILQGICPAPPLSVPAETVRAALMTAFQHYPRLKSYVLDDQEAVRKHVVIFLNNVAIQDRETQSDAIPEGEKSQIFVMQALSGG